MKDNVRILSIETHPKNLFFLLAVLCFWLYLLMFVLTSTAAAHSELVQSEPQHGAVLDESPAQVTAWFSEELDAETSTIRVFDSQSTQVDNGDGNMDLNDLDHLSMVVSLPPLQAGIYSVHWVTTSAEDGDQEEGEFTFSINGGAIASESSIPPASGSSTWLISGVIVLLLFGVLTWVVLRRRTSG